MTAPSDSPAPPDPADAGPAGEDAQGPYALRLLIVGTTPRSARAIVNIRKLCDEHLAGRYGLEVIDIAEHPEVAAKEQIIAAPTLIKTLPLPLRRFIGDMSQTERILLGLGLIAGESLGLQGSGDPP
jgi:circadian clock protein KaiB